MNIIWKQPNETLAVTSIFDGSNPVEHAQLLQSRGDVPSDWVVVATDYQGSFPAEKQESWRWVDGIVVDPVALKKIYVPKSISRRQLKLALNSLGLLSAVETYVSGADVNTQISWAETLDFERTNPMVLACASILHKTEDELDDIFILAGSL